MRIEMTKVVYCTDITNEVGIDFFDTMTGEYPSSSYVTLNCSEEHLNKLKEEQPFFPRDLRLSNEIAMITHLREVCGITDSILVYAYD